MTTKRHMNHYNCEPLLLQYMLMSRHLPLALQLFLHRGYCAALICCGSTYKEAWHGHMCVSINLYNYWKCSMAKIMIGWASWRCLIIKRNIAHCWNATSSLAIRITVETMESGSHAYVHAFTCVRPPLGCSAVAIVPPWGMYFVYPTTGSVYIVHL